MHFMPTRRWFFKTVAATFVSLIVPAGLRVGRRESSFWFLQADTGAYWEVADPVQWAIANVRLPVLERASEGLLKLTPDDGDRIIRLVVRRCGLNLHEIRSERVGVHHGVFTGWPTFAPYSSRTGWPSRTSRSCCEIARRKWPPPSMATTSGTATGSPPTGRWTSI